MNRTAGGTLPRVLHALAPAPVGGLESVVAMLAREWAERGGGAAIAMALDPIVTHSNVIAFPQMNTITCTRFINGVGF